MVVACHLFPAGVGESLGRYRVALDAARAGSDGIGGVRQYSSHAYRGRASPQPFGVIWYLTAAEAAELRDTLDGMLANEPDATWHEHVMSADGQVEVTVAWDSGQ